MKLNQATHAAWNSPNVTQNSQSQLGASSFVNPSAATQPNGTHTNPSQSQAQSSSQQPPHLNAPPGVPLPAGSYVTSSHNHAPGAITNAGAYTSNGLPAPGDPHVTNPNPNQNLPSNPHTQLHTNSHPQTPAQQVLLSVADRWGLLGLLAMIKNAGSEIDQGLISVGTDLGTMGLDMGYHG
jgi:CCR4-NOT transcription complex subunit 2